MRPQSVVRTAEERKGEAKDELARDQERADRKADEIANSERHT